MAHPRPTRRPPGCGHALAGNQSEGATDFRLEAIGPAYKQTRLTADRDGVYVARVQPPIKGWTAFFVELVYNTPGKVPLKLTTQVRIVPDILPFAWKETAP